MLKNFQTMPLTGRLCIGTLVKNILGGVDSNKYIGD